LPRLPVPNRPGNLSSINPFYLHPILHLPDTALFVDMSFYIF